MTFLADESSIEGSNPREGIEIVSPSTTWRVTSGSRDLVIDGKTFTAAPVNRDGVEVPIIERVADGVTINLPVSHAFPQRFIKSPPRTTFVNVYRKQTGGFAERIWQGKIIAMRCSGHIAKFQVPALLNNQVQRRLPAITTGRSCPHVLYDANCRVSRSGFRVNTTVSTVDGVTVEVASIGGNPDNWATYGELVHIPTGERATISEQVGTTITLKLPIFGMLARDAVQVFAGCDHSIATCSVVFNNRANYGGAPQMPRENPFIPTSKFGVIVQE